MQIFVNCLGTSKCISVDQINTIEQLKEVVRGEFEIDSEFSMYQGNLKIESNEFLGEEINDCNVEVMMDLIGGKGKKKRKNYTTPKKNKHRHKSTKLHALSYYAINKDGTVQKVKKDCPQKTCVGKGIVMAKHWNRYYCGKCSYTLMIVNAEKDGKKN